MQYFQAVSKGKQRAAKSQMKMFNAAGFGMLTLTTKKVNGVFEPVGEDELVTVIQSTSDANNIGYVVVIVDTDGFTKAQSKAVTSKEEAATIFGKLKRDEKMSVYPGRAHPDMVRDKTSNIYGS